MPKFDKCNEHTPLKFVSQFEAYVCSKNLVENTWGDFFLTAVQIKDVAWERRSRGVFLYNGLKSVFLSFAWVDVKTGQSGGKISPSSS